MAEVFPQPPTRRPGVDYGAGEIMSNPASVAPVQPEAGAIAQSSTAEMPGPSSTLEAAARVEAARRSVQAAHEVATKPVLGREKVTPPSSPPGSGQKSGTVYQSRAQVIGTHMGANESPYEFHLDSDPWLGLDPANVRMMAQTPEGRDALLRRERDIAAQRSDRLRFERGSSVELDAQGNASGPMVNPHGKPLAPRFRRVAPDSSMFEPRVYGDPRAGSNIDPRAQRPEWTAPPVDRTPPKEDEPASDQLTFVERAKHRLAQLLRSRKEERRTASTREASLDVLEADDQALTELGLGPRPTQADIAAHQRALAAKNPAGKNTYREKGGYTGPDTGSYASRAPITYGDPNPPKNDGQVPRSRLRITRT